MANRPKKTPRLPTVELQIDRWVHSGQAMAYDAAGRVVFVQGVCVPGDRVRVQLTRVKKRWARGELVAVIAPGPHRAEPSCGVLSRCGGCPWMLANRDTQRQQRLRILSDEIHKVWGDSASGVPVVDGTPSGSVPAFGYRRRARWAFERDGTTPTVGYRARRSHDVVDASGCVVVVPSLLELHKEVLRRIKELPTAVRRGEVHVLAGPEGAGATCLDPHAEVLFRLGPPKISVPTAGRDVSVEPTMFAQANEAVTDAIWRWVQGQAREAAASWSRSPRHAVELFAGAGTFTSALTDAGWTVDAYDSAPRQNPMDGARFHHAELIEAGVPWPPPAHRPGLILLDPPRAGAAELMDWVMASGAETILYVSCDLATALRDVRQLGPYILERAWSFDMFPHSGHQEIALLLRRAPHGA